MGSAAISSLPENVKVICCPRCSSPRTVLLTAAGPPLVFLARRLRHADRRRLRHFRREYQRFRAGLENKKAVTLLPAPVQTQTPAGMEHGLKPGDVKITVPWKTRM